MRQQTRAAISRDGTWRGRCWISWTSTKLWMVWMATAGMERKRCSLRRIEHEAGMWKHDDYLTTLSSQASCNLAGRNMARPEYDTQQAIVLSKRVGQTCPRAERDCLVPSLTRESSHPHG